MSEDIKKEIYRLLATIMLACDEIQDFCVGEVKKTEDRIHLIAWQKDYERINNIRHIAEAVKADVDTNMISKCMELMLRRTSKELRKQFRGGTISKELREKVFSAFDEIHKEIIFLVL